MPELRLADLLAGLSRFADLGFGLRAGTALRSCALATRLARATGLPDSDVADAFYTALLHHVGCAGFAHETARLFGDEIVANRAAGRTDTASPADVLVTFLPALTRGRPTMQAARTVAAAIVKGDRWGAEFTATACEVGRDCAEQLGLPEQTQTSLFHVYDVWRGKGLPETLSGDDIPVGARIARLSGVACLFESTGGTELAMRAVSRRAGGMLDPALSTSFAANAATWFREIAESDTRALALESEPEPHVRVEDLRQVALVFADLADLKSPYFLGHSRGVGQLAAEAAERIGLQADAAAELEIAGLLHDLGRIAISNAAWDQPHRTGDDEWEQMRLHPYHSERILAGSSALSSVAPVAGRHHERLDGSGYHRGCRLDDLPLPARILAAADAYQTATEPRPHRPALDPEQAQRRLLGDASRGQLDADAVRAVLAAAGPGKATDLRPLTRSLPAGLSSREAEVLALVARGCSNREIAARLVISPRTAEHHVQHVYTKIGVSGRAAATLFAVRHDLVQPDR